MNKLLSKLKLNATDLLSQSDLANYRGGCNMQTCVNCCNTAVYYSCNSSGNYNACVQNICSQCFSYFSSWPTGCYC